MAQFLKSISAFFCALSSFLWGDMDGLLIALVAMMAIDYATGVLNAIRTHSLNSEIGYMGLLKKGVILFIVAVGNILDTHLLGGTTVCRNAIIGFYIANEGLSILENGGKLGLPLPKQLRRALEQLRDTSDEKEKKDESKINET